MMQFPESPLKNDQPHRSALILQRAALTEKRQKMISDRERAVVAGRHESPVHLHLHSPRTSTHNRMAQACRRQCSGSAE
jgi:hypothetical protein